MSYMERITKLTDGFKRIDRIETTDELLTAWAGMASQGMWIPGVDELRSISLVHGTMLISRFSIIHSVA